MSEAVVRRRSAETLAREVEDYLSSGVPVGEYLADQLLLPLALGAGGALSHPGAIVPYQNANGFAYRPSRREVHTASMQVRTSGSSKSKACKSPRRPCSPCQTLSPWKRFVRSFSSQAGKHPGMHPARQHTVEDSVFHTAWTVTEYPHASPRCVVLFGVGGGGLPERHHPMLQALQNAGAQVLAPHYERVLPGRVSQAQLALRTRGLSLALEALGAPIAPVVGLGHSLGAAALLALGGAELWWGPSESWVSPTLERLTRLALLAPAAGFFLRPGPCGTCTRRCPCGPRGKTNSCRSTVFGNSTKDFRKPSVEGGVAKLERGTFRSCTSLHPTRKNPSKTAIAFWNNCARH